MKEVFKVKSGETELELAVLRPTPELQVQAQKLYNRKFREFIEGGAFFRFTIESYVKDQDIWNESRQKEEEKLQKSIQDGLKKLKLGGVKLSEAREIAIGVKKDRVAIRNLRSDVNAAYNDSAESQAENARFNFLVSCCTVYNTDGKAYFKDLEDYLSRSGEEPAIEAATHLAAIMFGLERDFEQKLPENQFLMKYGFMDAKLRFVNKQGKLVDLEGRLINEDGFFVTENGELCDINGNLVDKDGNQLVESKPFLTDEGEKV